MSVLSHGLVHETSMWANMRIISLKVGVTRSLRTRQMLKVDLCANRAGAYAPYAPPLPTGLSTLIVSSISPHLNGTSGECAGPAPSTVIGTTSICIIGKRLLLVNDSVYS